MKAMENRADAALKEAQLGKSGVAQIAESVDWDFFEHWNRF